MPRPSDLPKTLEFHLSRKTMRACHPVVLALCEIAPESRTVLFSVIIPTYNRPAHVRELLLAWEAVDFPRDQFELLLADDGGTVDLAAVVAKYGANVPVHLLRLPHVSASSARASALSRARGRFVICSDDDCRPDPMLLEVFRRATTEFRDAAIGGQVLNMLESDVFATATQEIISFVVEEWNKNPLDAKFFTVSNLLFPAEALRAAGGFDPSWLWRTGEDRDICQRWCETGQRMVFCPDALMWHAHGLTLGKFCRQHFHYGEGNCGTWKKKVVAGAGAPALSGPGFYARLIARPFKKFRLAVALKVLAAISLAQLANIAGFAAALAAGTRRTRPKES